MSDIICVSQPQKLYLVNWSAPGHSEESPGKLISWNSNALDAPTLISGTTTFDGVCFFNSICIELHEEYTGFFPSKLRFEASIDGNVWEPLLHEVEYRVGPHKKARWNFALVSARYLKFVFLTDKKNQAGKYFIAFGELQVLISGTVKITASSELDRLWVKENIIDQRAEYGWSTALRAHLEKEYIQMDLGSVNRLCEARILSKDDTDTFFPTSFQLLYSEDNISWHLLFEENGFLTEAACWYRWRFLPVNARYISLVILEGVRTHEGKYISQIIEIELYATTDLLDKSNFASSPPPASTLRSGVVRLALDGESKEGVALQASDRRLLDATTTRKGIIELASSGEEKEGQVVQANDQRLKYATEELPGIVRLARHEETRAMHVVQSNDPRLELATEEKAGLVELATDGETRAGVATQANDKRLCHATTKNAGIVKLAKNGSEEPNEVVQGNDHRLSKASLVSDGITRLARHGEEVAEVAVQSDDPRLQAATTEQKGIVELATDGEKNKGKVIQGNDSRLKEGTEKTFGIVQLAPLNSTVEGHVVQSHDPRLSNERKPLAHEHDYASKEHDFNSHSGTLNLKKTQGQTFKGINIPPSDHAPISGINQGNGAGLVGQGQKEGIIGTGSDHGVIGYGVGNGRGVLGASRKNIGGTFLSENFYSLVAGGDLEDRNIQASQLAFLAKGLARFEDTIYSYAKSGSIASYFPIKENENMSPGNLVAVDKKSKEVYRPQGYGNLRLLGVVVTQAAIVLEPPKELLPSIDEFDNQGPFTFPPLVDKALVAIGGIVKVKASAKKKPIYIGDLLVSSSEIGTAECLEPDRYRPGMVFARSLDILEQGNAEIKAILIVV